MIAIRNLPSLLLSALLLAALAGCGDDDDPVASNPGTNPPANDVTLEQLEGTWFGTFDTKTSVQTFEFTVDNAGNMSAINLEGVDTNLTGTVTKATEIPRAFRFAINSSGGQIAQGMMLLDPSATYMVYLDEHQDFAVVQKGANALPAYALTDIDAAWAGDAASSTADFTTFTRRDTSGTCAPSDPATVPPSSQCAVDLGNVSRTVSDITMDNARGRFLGSFSDDPPPSSAPNAAWRAYLSPDKNFAAVWACTDFANGWPESCDFSSWRKQ